MRIFQGLVVSCLLGVFVGWSMAGNRYIKYTQEQPTKTIIIQPQQKDTSSYHWSDEYTDNQLREMCREGYLKLK